MSKQQSLFAAAQEKTPTCQIDADQAGWTSLSRTALSGPGWYCALHMAIVIAVPRPPLGKAIPQSLGFP